VRPFLHAVSAGRSCRIGRRFQPTFRSGAADVSGLSHGPLGGCDAPASGLPTLLGGESARHLRWRVPSAVSSCAISSELGWQQLHIDGADRTGRDLSACPRSDGETADRAVRRCRRSQQPPLQPLTTCLAPVIRHAGILPDREASRTVAYRPPVGDDVSGHVDGLAITGAFRGVSQLETTAGLVMGRGTASHGGGSLHERPQLGEPAGGEGRRTDVKGLVLVTVLARFWLERAVTGPGMEEVRVR
jgi:hypothetical protein